MGKDLKGKELGVGISQRKDGLYQGRYIDRWGRRKTIYNKNLRELRKQLAEAIAGNENFSSIKQEITLDRWFERWMEIYKEKSVRPNTKREYDYIYRKHISPHIGARNVDSLVKSDIQLLIDHSSNGGCGYELQSKIKVVLRDMLQRAVEDNLAVNNPVSGIRLRADKDAKSRSLTLDEQNTFFEFCRNTFYDNLFNVAVNTGLRPGELFALQISDIDIENGFINVNKTLVYQKYLTDTAKTFHIEPPKTKQSCRKVPINSVCRTHLLRQLDLKEIISKKISKDKNDYLFVTRYNSPLCSTVYSHAIKSIVNKINLIRPNDEQFETFSGHTFRHTFATRCFESGVDAKVVQSYLGHSSLKMTMDLYTHVTEDKSVTDIEKIVPRSDSNVVDIRRMMA